MSTDDIERFDLRSTDPFDERLAVIRELFPEAIREGKVDFEALRRSVGDWVEPGPERFGLNWPGKADCMRVIQEASVGTLAPMPGKSVDWDTTQNVIVEGENLEVLKLLQKAYYGKVKLIYIDPPYNTGKEFIYPDNFKEGLADYLRYSGQVDEDGFKLSANAETDGRYHSKWLSMMYPRLFLARNLLSEDGMIFVSIDDHEVHHLRSLMSEIFGEENFVGMITRNTGTPTGGGSDGLVNTVDYILVFSRSELVSVDGLELSTDDESIYNQNDEKGRYLTRPLRRTGGEDRREDRPTMYFAIAGPDGADVFPVAPEGYASRWRCGESRYKQLVAEGMIEWKNQDDDGSTGWRPYQKFYLEGRKKQPSNLWTDLDGNKKGTRELKELFSSEKVFDSPKPVGLIAKIIEIACDSDSLVLDFFAGSGSTAHAVLEMNAKDGGTRRFILVQLPESTSNPQYPTIAAITRERVRAAGRRIAEAPLALSSTPADFGFQSYSLTPSNFAIWDATATDPGTIETQLTIAVDHVVPDVTETSILVELLLKAGYSLTSPVETLDFAGVPGYAVADGALIVCLSNHLSIDAFEAMVEHEPAMVLVLDAGFGGSDELKVNALQTVRARNRQSGSDISLRVV